jgi:glycosyltransferase involved in cell wall biosynthesis
MNKFISVIIPCYNSFNTIEYTLDGLMQQNKDYLKEIIIVDSSEDNKRMNDIINKYDTSLIKLINAGIKVIPAIGRNIGAAHSKGKLLVFIDSDAYPHSDWIDNIVDAFSRGRLVAGGGIDIPEFQIRSKIALAQLFLQMNEFLCVGKEKPKMFTPSVNLYCEKSLFEKAGGFPEIRASEDVLFGLKINKIETMWFLPQCKVFHIFRENIKQFRNNQELLGKYVMIYRRMYYKKFIYKSIIPVILFPVFMGVKIARIISRIIAAGRKNIFLFIRCMPFFAAGLFYWSKGFIKACYKNENK